MMLRVKTLAISTGNPLIAIVNYIDAQKLDLHYSDRIRIRAQRREIVAMIDICSSNDLLLPGQIGLFEEVSTALDVHDTETVRIRIEDKPRSLHYIKNKLRGKKLTEQEIREIVRDITNDRLTEVELTYFVAASYVHELTDEETVAYARAMVGTGERLRLRETPVLDKHCIGGVAGNRTTMIVVPIVAALGLCIPKTSSRSITSAAGTADTVEVLCDVAFPLDKMRRIVEKTKGCFVWGGSVSLAPADDKIIKVEHPVSLDPVGGLIASILAKKKSVSATHVIIDIPVGRGAKTENRARARMLKARFERIGKRMGMKILVVITDGSQPVGNGIGPALEARDVLWVLQNSPKGPLDLREKSLMLAGKLLELAGAAKSAGGKRLARDVLESGRAYRKFVEIIRAQNAKAVFPEQIGVGAYNCSVRAEQSGQVSHVDNKRINRIAKLAGAPHDPMSGLYLHVHRGSRIKKGEKLFTVYSNSKERLKFARQFARQYSATEIRKGGRNG